MAIGFRRRSVAVLTMASLLAGLTATAVVAPAAAGDCHYTFPAAGGVYDVAPVTAGQVICGGPGDDVVAQMDGGRFFGRGGDDMVGLKNGGQFFGNGGYDSVVDHFGGAFVGGLGKDFIEDFFGGRFLAGSGNDAVRWLDDGAVFYGGPGNDQARWINKGGVFFGAAGRDRVTEQLSGIFVGGRGWDDVFRINGGGRFYGNRGNDAVDRGGGIYDAGAMFTPSFFNGGPGYDFADICPLVNPIGITIKKVEATADDCPSSDGAATSSLYD